MPTRRPTSQPHSLEAERSVLGAVLLDPESMLKVRDRLEADDFYDPVYRTIWEACTGHFDAGKPIDFVTVASALADNKQLSEIGGSAFLAELTASTPTASVIEHYAGIVREKAGLRALIQTGQAISALGWEEDQEFTDLVGTAQHELLTLADRTISQAPEQLGEMTKRRYDVFAEVKEGGDSEEKRRVRSGFANVDYYFNGFEPTSLNIIAGRPGMGKTALLLNMAVNAAHGHDKRVLFFSLEMSKEQLAHRIVAGALSLSPWEMQRGRITDDKMREYGQVVDQLETYPLFIDDDPDSSLANIRATALRHQLEHGLDALFVDYLQLIEPPARISRNANRTEQVSAISRDLKRLARELKTPVIAGCQLSRATENRPQNIPQLADLRESGTIEQDADNVLMLWREGYYHEDCENPDVTTVFVRKNRQGPTGAAELVFQQDTMTFSSLDRHHEGGESTA